MRRLAAALIASTLLLTACSGDAEEAAPDATPTESAEAAPESSATPEDVAALDAVTVDGDLGAAPTLTFEQPFSIANAVARVDTEGEGADLADGQALSIHYVAVSGDDGTALGSTWDLDAPEQITLGDPQIIPALNEVLAGQKVGVRVLFAAPGAEATEGTEAYPATLMAIEVVDARDVPTRAEGEPVEPAEGLPTVTLADDGAPAIEIPEGTEAPTELVVQPLIKGEGAVVEAGQNLTVQYTGVKYSDGSTFDSSWENGAPFTTTIGAGQVIPGWDEGLVGQTVGSQVLLVVPPAQGYGGTESELAEETLVFVVDILDAS